MPFVEHKPGGAVAGISGRTVDLSSAAVPPGPPPGKTMVWVPGGTFTMGSHDFYPEERPVHRVSVDGFWMDEHPVTVGEFRRFVKATSYVTVAERPLDPATYPEADPALLVPGSLVFRKTWGPVNLNDYRQWWAYVPGATWQHPEGPASTLHGRERHPVVHITYEDAEAYATWAGKALPTEAEWECAARGGLDGAVFTWGDEVAPQGRMMANTWQGAFPWQNLRTDGYEGTSPVGSFPPNGYGLYDMAGNVWEWTCDYFTPRHPEEVSKPCCVPHNPRVAAPRQSYVLGQPGAHIARKVIKGGLAPVRADLLPALPAGGASGRDGRDLDRAHRVPLCCTRAGDGVDGGTRPPRHRRVRLTPRDPSWLHGVVP